MRRGDYRNYYKGHMDKAKEGKSEGVRQGGGVGRKCRKLYLNNNKKKL